MKTNRIFQLIDLDRTLFDTSRFARLLTEEIDMISPGFGKELDHQFEEAYAREETFFLLRYLREEMGNEAFEQMVERVVEREGSESFYLPGALQRIELANSFSSLRPSWGVLTYGDGIDQFMKMKIIGLENVPVFLSDSPDKGALVSSWLTDSGEYALPDAFGGARADLLTFEDDKLRAFYGLPDSVVSIWVTQYDDAHERLLAAGLRAIVVRDLAESVAYLRENFSLVS